MQFESMKVRAKAGNSASLPNTVEKPDEHAATAKHKKGLMTNLSIFEI
jgi:hypothetical protein